MQFVFLFGGMAWASELLALLHHTSDGSVSPARPSSRSRDVFPLPAFAPSTEGCPASEALVVDMVKLSVLALNSVNGTPGFRATTREVHRAVHQMLAGKVSGLRMHVDDGQSFLSGPSALSTLLGATAPDQLSSACPPTQASSRLRADDVDLLECSGRVDTLPHLPDEVRAMVTTPSLLFNGKPDSARHFRAVGAQDRSEYARLVALQLRS